MPLWALGLGAGLISDGDRRRGMWECRCVSVAARVPVRVCDFVCGKTARGRLGLGVTVSRPFVVHSSQAQVGEGKEPILSFQSGERNLRVHFRDSSHFSLSAWVRPRGAKSP